MKHIKTIFLTALIAAQLNGQSDSLNLKALTKYFQTSMGLSYGHLIGNVSEFTQHGGSLDMNFADGRAENLYGFNMNVLLSNKRKEFSIPPGYEHYDSPATLFFGLFYGRIFGKQHKSHYQGVIGLNYGWLLHRKQDQDIGGYHGLAPQIEFSRSIRIGKTKFSAFQHTSQYTPMRFDPSLSEKFIDICIGYKQLLFNSLEGKGGLFTFGIRYKLNKYSIHRNRMN